MFKREDYEELEYDKLKSYACKSRDAKRTYDTEEHEYRTRYERDKDRIIYSRAFRRLEYKTQVYVFDVDDHVRTRLTHTLEVSRIARNIARVLGVNEDLTEAIALGHDLGHTPFGHAGEKALDEILSNNGHWGFKHNVQGVRIVDRLEKKYFSHDGLNLTWDVREGILKHTKLPDGLPPERYPTNCKDLALNIPFSTTVEGQIVNVADEIAQRCHDLDDCWELGLIDFDRLKKLEIYQVIQDFYLEERKYDMNHELVKREEEDKKRLFTRCLTSFLITDVIRHSDEVLFLVGKRTQASGNR
ncbi:MAG: dNTP triphosphohydrolase [Peptococcaceae bacterium]|nr:dNTP triphosphohydrolase [Peptococcaceae bacterium]